MTRQRRSVPDARRWRDVLTATANWSFNPGAILLLATVTTAYVMRWRRVRHEQGTLSLPIWRLLVFLGGILAAAAALISPIDAYAEKLFVIHMVQHLLLLDVAPILCILGLTKVLRSDEDEFEYES